MAKVTDKQNEQYRAACAALDAIDDYDQLRLILQHGIAREKHLEHIKAMAFTPGDKASFICSKPQWRGQRFVGVVESVNTKTVSLDCGVHGRWRVSPSMLTKEPDRVRLGGE